MSVYLPYYIHSPQNQASTYSLSFLIIIVREGFADFILNFIFLDLIFFPLFSPGAQLRWMRLDTTRGAGASGVTAGRAAPSRLTIGRPLWWCLTPKVGALISYHKTRDTRLMMGPRPDTDLIMAGGRHQSFGYTFF